MIGSIASVVTHRTATLCMLLVNPTPRRRREAVRMVTEKLEAAWEGALAMQVTLLKQGRSFWVGSGRGRLRSIPLVRFARRVVVAGGAPARRRLEANRRRLGRRKVP